MAGTKRKAASDGDDTGRGRLKKHTDSITDARGEINANVEDEPGVYEIRRAGMVLMSSPIKNLGYPDYILKDMARHGMHLYYNGKRVKL